jgi:hypothetical protein
MVEEIVDMMRVENVAVMNVASVVVNVIGFLIPEN